MPRSSARWFHSDTRFRSGRSRFVPSSATVSYSGPFTRPAPSISTSRPHITGQWMQLDFTPVSAWSAMNSPDTFSASA